MRILVVFNPEPSNFWSTDTLTVECENRDVLDEENLIRIIGIALNDFENNFEQAKSIINNKYYFLVELRETECEVEKDGRIIFPAIDWWKESSQKLQDS